MYNNVKGLSMVKVYGENGHCQQLFVGCFNERLYWLLQRWSEFVREVDPDIITGYNIQNFDFPYLLDRAAHLKVSSAMNSCVSVMSSCICVMSSYIMSSCFRRWLISWWDRVSAGGWVRVFPRWHRDFVMNSYISWWDRVFPQVADFVYLGRIKDLKSVMKTSTIQSRQMGKRENKVINIDGRVQFDLLQVRLNPAPVITHSWCAHTDPNRLRLSYLH